MKEGFKNTPIKSNRSNYFWVRIGGKISVNHEVNYKILSDEEVEQQKNELQEQITRLDSPILHHTQRIDDYLNLELKRNNVKITLNDLIGVRLVPGGGKELPNLEGRRQPQPIDEYLRYVKF